MPPPRQRRRASGAPLLRLFLNPVVLVILSVVVGLAAFLWLRPLELLFSIIQIRLRFSGIRSEFASVDGQRIRYFVGGSGTPIVLVHGLGSRSEDWVGLLPQLVQAGHRVYALDLLGYGRSSAPRDAAYSIAQEAGVVEKFIAGQNLNQTDLAGWSMGGWVAMRVALDEPARIRRLAIYDSAGLRYDLPFYAPLFWPDNTARLNTLSDLLAADRGPRWPAFIQRDIFRRVRRNGWVVQRTMQSMLTGVDILDGKLSALKMPMLIVWGKQDKITPAALGYKIHSQVPQSVLEIYDGCGHLAARECSERIGPNTVAFFNAEPPLAAQAKEYPRPEGK
jgi:pimeloyl-ACP methyl ester carboxylesterase